MKKVRPTFPDDFMTDDSLSKLGPCNIPRIKREAESSSTNRHSPLIHLNNNNNHINHNTNNNNNNHIISNSTHNNNNNNNPTTPTPTTTMILNSNNMSPCSLQPIVRKRSALQVSGPGSSTLNCGSIAESSPEVSSSQTGTGISPVPSLNSSEIGEVDLDFWDLDINESSSISHSSGKEDMSPPNSVNGYNSADSFGDPKKKKGPAPRQQEELCLVCGDRASGYHYNALTCEGCKGFFRRSITKNAVYQCKYGNNCDIDMYMRRKCQECRLKKCLNVGMRPECVVPEYQCAIKRESKRAQKEKDKPNSTTKETTPDKEKKTLVLGETKSPTTPTTLTPNEIKPLSPQQQEIIKQLVYYQDLHESPSDVDVKCVTPFPVGESEDDAIKRFQHMAEMTIFTVQLIVEFSKRVPGFDTLLREDQITLLKSCSSEIMMLRCCRKYDIKTDSIVYANNQPYTKENYLSASIGPNAEAIFIFCRQVCLLAVDNAEYALLTAIVIFSERPQLIEPKKVEKIQDFYIETLKCYIENHRPPVKCYFAKLLSILVELRTLGSINSELCFSLKVRNKQLPPFLAEIWDIQE